MPNVSSLIGLCLIGLMLGCNASKNNHKSNSADTTYVDSTVMNSDSFPPPPTPGPAPGHARIQAELVDVTEATTEQRYMTLTFLVTKVESYGASTPPLAVRDTVEVKADKSAIEGTENSLGKIVTAIISYRQVILGDDQSPKWTLVTLD